MLRYFLIMGMLRYSKTGTFAYGVLIVFKNNLSQSRLMWYAAKFLDISGPRMHGTAHNSQIGPFWKS